MAVQALSHRLAPRDELARELQDDGESGVGPVRQSSTFPGTLNFSHPSRCPVCHSQPVVLTHCNAGRPLLYDLQTGDFLCEDWYPDLAHDRLHPIWTPFGGICNEPSPLLIPCDNSTDMMP